MLGAASSTGFISADQLAEPYFKVGSAIERPKEAMLSTSRLFGCVRWQRTVVVVRPHELSSGADKCLGEAAKIHIGSAKIVPTQVVEVAPVNENGDSLAHFALPGIPAVLNREGGPPRRPPEVIA